MGVYQVMTEFLRLPKVGGCDLEKANITTTSLEENENASN
jgi:hypothetical protein